MKGPYLFDPRSLRYRSASSGRWVKATQVKGVVSSAQTRAAESVRAISEQLRRGEITVGQWKTAMREETKLSGLHALASSRGGFANLTQSDYGRLGQWLSHGAAGGKGQYQYLDAFAEQIKAGLPLDGRFLRRSQMYTHAASGLFELERISAREVRGFDEIKSIRYASDSCQGCVEQERRGWQPLRGGGWVPPGARQCLSACRCTTTMRNSVTGAVAE